MKSKSIKNCYKSCMSTLSLIVMISQNTLASGIGGSSLFTGAKRLAQDITNWIVGAAAVFGVLMISYCFFRKIHSDQDKARMWNDRIKTIGGSIVGIIVAASVVQIILSYFGG